MRESTKMQGQGGGVIIQFPQTQSTLLILQLGNPGDNSRVSAGGTALSGGYSDDQELRFHQQ